MNLFTTKLFLTKLYQLSAKLLAVDTPGKFISIQKTLGEF